MQLVSRRQKGKIKNNSLQLTSLNTRAVQIWSLRKLFYFFSMILDMHVCIIYKRWKLKILKIWYFVTYKKSQSRHCCLCKGIWKLDVSDQTIFIFYCSYSTYFDYFLVFLIKRIFLFGSLSVNIELKHKIKSFYTF